MNYRINKSLVQELFQNIGKYYVSKIIDPVTQESVKSGITKFTTKKLIAKRSEVKDIIEEIMMETFF